jgi:hypothetical protein
MNQYDIIVIIPSYDRYDMLVNLLTKLSNSIGEYKVKIIVNNDGSKDKRYYNLKTLFNDVIFLNEKINNGKYGYWITITNLLTEAKKYDFKYLFTIDDDFDICDNFFKLLVKEHEESKKLDDKIVCTSYGTTLKDMRWGVDNWFDGGAILDKSFIELIEFKIEKTKRVNKNRGSGVWKQVSIKLNNFGFKVHKPDYNAITHLGHTDSKMHPQYRKINPLIIEKTI